MNRTGVLLINLGTPDAPTPEAVGRYLREFLMDGYVIDLPKPLRWFFVHVMIVPRRKEQSAKAYQKVQLPKAHLCSYILGSWPRTSRLGSIPTTIDTQSSTRCVMEIRRSLPRSRNYVLKTSRGLWCCRCIRNMRNRVLKQR